MKRTMNLIAKGQMIFVLPVPFLFKSSTTCAQSRSANWICTSVQLAAYNNAFLSTISTNPTLTEDLGITIQGTPYLKADAPAGDSSITIPHFKM